MIEAFNLRVIFEYGDLFLKGMWATVWISVLGLAGALLIGVVTCTARISGVKAVSIASVCYIEL